MRELLHDAAPGPDWDKLRPVLDAVMHELKDADREAILMRYFENRALIDIGEKFGLSENAARMRVDRALEKLRTLLTRRGVTTTVASLSAVISANAVQIAPAGLVAMLTSASLAGVAGTGGALTFLELMATTKLKLGLTTLVIAGAATTLVVQHLSRVSLREENQSLRQQVAQLNIDKENLSNRMALGRAARVPRLPAPAIQVAAPDPAASETLSITNLYARLMANNPLTLTAQQIQPYLDANQRSAASLLAGFRTTGDAALLEEAMQKFPNDPQVSFEAAFKKDVSPAERRQWLDAFKNSATDNPLANYLSAADYFKTGQTDEAVKELIAASGKPRFQDYSLERIQDDEEAFRAAGYRVAQAKMAACSQLLLPQLAWVKELARNTVELANSYQQAGDEASRQAALQMAVNLGRRYSEGAPGEPLISQLVGIAAERIALSAMDPSSPYDGSGQTVQDRVDQLTQQRVMFKGLTQQTDAIFQTMSEQDWISYHTRSTAFGEEAALRWLVNKYGQQVNESRTPAR
jgi:cell division protein FtsL